MKTIAAALLAVVVSFANRRVELVSLENMQALDQVDHRAKDALIWVNENALDYLPVAATLRAENALAGFFVSQKDVTKVATR